MNTWRKNSRFGAAIAWATGIALAISACSATEAPGENPYAAEFAQALAESSSDYEKEILADGKVTHQEYMDSINKMVTCLRHKGLAASVMTDSETGFAYLEIPEAAGLSDGYGECDSKWGGSISSLYENVFANPGNENMDGLIATCLVRKGFAPKGFTGSDYARLMEENSMGNIKIGGIGGEETLVEGQELLTAPPQAPIEIPGGSGNLDDDEAMLCEILPLK